MVLEQALMVPDLPEITQTILNLAEFMEHCEKVSYISHYSQLRWCRLGYQFSRLTFLPYFRDHYRWTYNCSVKKR